MSSRIEDLIEALVEGKKIDFSPGNRIEQALVSCINKTGSKELGEPKTRIEMLLYALSDRISKSNEGGLNLNIEFGDTEPNDTSKLWIKTSPINKVIINDDPLPCSNGSIIGSVEAEFVSPARLKTWVNKNLYRISTATDPKALLVVRYNPLLRISDKFILEGTYSPTCVTSSSSKIYIVCYNNVIVFNTETESFEILEIASAADTNTRAIIVNNKLYIIRLNYSSIKICDLENSTSTNVEGLSAKVYNIGLASVDTDIFVFGGNTSASYNSGNLLSTIYKFNTLTNEMSTLDVALPKNLNCIAAVAADRYIYLFGGYDKSSHKGIYIFDTTKNTIEESPTKLFNEQWDMCAGYAESKIYLQGGDGVGGNTSNISFTGVYQYDISNNVLSILSPTHYSKLGTGINSINVDEKIYTFIGREVWIYDTKMKKTEVVYHDQMLSYPNCVANGNKIYLFGGMNSTSICVFNTDDNTLEVLSVELPVQLHHSAMVSIDSMIYILGGCIGTNLHDANAQQSSVYAFDIKNQSVTLLSEQLKIPVSSSSYVLIDSILYIIGGIGTTNVRSIQTFDTQTKRTDVLPLTLPGIIQFQSAFSIGRNIYLIDKNLSMLIINVDTCTFFSTLPGNGLSGSPSTNFINTAFSVCVVGDEVYVCGYYTARVSAGQISYADVIYTISLPRLNAGLLKIVNSSAGNKFKLINGDISVEIGVDSIYIGDNTNTPVYINAYLHDGSDWVPIA